jgi:hypothetical protein
MTNDNLSDKIKKNKAKGKVWKKMNPMPEHDYLRVEDVRAFLKDVLSEISGKAEYKEHNEIVGTHHYT